MNSIIDLFFQRSEEMPGKTAIWCDGRQITYRELSQKVIQYANLFLQSGVQYGDHIGFPMNNSIETVAVFLAAAEIGAALVPMNPTLPPDAVVGAFSSGNVSHLIARKSFLEKYRSWTLPQLPGKMFCLDAICEGSISMCGAGHFCERRPQIRKTGKELFIIILTSGSTGIPKPVALTQEDKYKRACWHNELYHMTREDRVLAATPLYHVLADRLVFVPLMLGATSILLPRFTPELWLECVKKQQVTFTMAVSAQLAQISRQLSKQGVSGIESLRCIVSSSALLEPHVRVNLLRQLSCDIHEIYGTSELSMATDINFAEAIEKQNSVGRPLPGISISIIKENGDKCVAGEVGEIICRTPMLCSGYYGKNDIFQNSMKNGYFCTGDLGYLDEDGYLYFSGRKKELIITGGINVYPIDIEECIQRIPGVSECAAFSYPDDCLGEVVAVAVVMGEEGNVTERDIQILCSKSLANYQQPHKIFFVKELPKNAMGKLVRRNLLKLICDRNIKWKDE